jgi:hypothetical protein
LLLNKQLFSSFFFQLKNIISFIMTEKNQKTKQSIAPILNRDCENEDEQQLKLGEILLDMNILTEEEVKLVLFHQNIKDCTFGELAIRLGYLTDSELVKALAFQAEIDVFDFDDHDIHQINVELLSHMPMTKMKQLCVLPFGHKKNGAMQIAICHQTSPEKLQQIVTHFGNCVFLMASKSDILKALDKLEGKCVIYSNMLTCLNTENIASKESLNLAIQAIVKYAKLLETEAIIFKVKNKKAHLLFADESNRAILEKVDVKVEVAHRLAEEIKFKLLRKPQMSRTSIFRFNEISFDETISVNIHN